MKLIHLISGGDVGGAKTHVLSLLQGLGKSHTVQLVCFMEGEFAADARAMGIHTSIIKSANVLADCRKIAGLIQTEGYEIVHCHGSRANMMGALLRTMVKVPVVTTVHSDPKLDYLGRPIHRLTFGTINAIALRFLDYYIGVSDAMGETLIERGFDPQRIFAIYNGVDFSTVRTPKPRDTYLQELGLSYEKDSVIFGIAARISPVKDMPTLVRGFAQAVKAHPNARLVIAGDGEQAQEVKALAGELCPEGSVCFAGWVTDMDSFYHAMDVNCLTSLSETFPYALTEGARMHCATIASRVGGIPYLIDDGENGLLFPAQDADALGAQMTLLIEDPALRRSLGEKLYTKTKECFSVEATVHHQEALYRSILSRYARKKEKRDGVLICGAYGRGNLGDDAILQAIVGQLREIDPALPIYALSRHPMNTKKTYRIGACHTFWLPGYLRIMKKTRLYLSGGGTLVQNVTSGRSLLYYLANIRRAHRKGNHVVMYGCGIGPVKGRFARWLTGKTVKNHVDTVTLRDKDSLEELRRLGVEHPNVHLTADPALLLCAAPPEKTKGILRTLGLAPEGQYFLLSPRPWQGLPLDAFAACAQYAYETYGLTPVLFALEPDRDQPVVERLAQSLSCPCRIVPQTSGGVETVLTLISQMQLVLSMRLHTLIFAAGQGVPLAGVVYDPKVEGFLHYLGQDNYVSMENATAQSLCAMVDRAMSQGGANEETLRKMHRLAEENGEILKKILLEENT